MGERRLTVGQRLTAIFAAMSAFELTIGAGWPQHWIWLLHWRGPLWRYVSLFREMAQQLVGPLFSVLYFATAVVALFAVSLRFARGAVPGSARDPLKLVRDFFRRHTTVASLLPWVPAALLTSLVGVALLNDGLWRSREWMVPMYIAKPFALAVMGSLVALLGRHLLNTLDQLPDATEAQLQAAQTAAGQRDETTFLAVAVTARTKGHVLAMSLVTLGMLVFPWIGTDLSLPGWAMSVLMPAYAAALVGWAAWFRKASTIAVGRDGVFVRGTAKERFIAYGSFDEVRLTGISLDLVKNGERLVRLQLHGADAARAESLAERIRTALGQARRTDGAHLLARVATSGALGRAARGATDYREAAVSREQLWELVEGEATDGAARLAAATALAGGGDRQERARLRIAAVHVADPRVRVALEELAEDDEVAALMLPGRRLLPKATS